MSWQDAWDLALDQDDGSGMEGSGMEGEDDLLEFDEEEDDCTRAAPNPLQSVQEQALRLPQLLIALRDAGDLDALRSAIELNFSPECTFSTETLDQPVVGRDVLLKFVSCTLDVFPDSYVTFKRARLSRPGEVTFECVVRGTRTDSIRPGMFAVEGREMLFGAQELHMRDFFRRKLAAGIRRALSATELQRIKAMEDKFSRQKALAQLEMLVQGQLRFQLNPQTGGPVVTHASHRWKLLFLSAAPLG
jgi:hypothetical protein